MLFLKDYYCIVFIIIHLINSPYKYIAWNIISGVKKHNIYSFSSNLWPINFITKNKTDSNQIVKTIVEVDYLSTQVSS